MPDPAGSVDRSPGKEPGVPEPEEVVEVEKASPQVESAAAPSDRNCPVLRTVRIDHIDVDPARVRSGRDEHGVGILAASIATNGLLHPLLVQSLPDSDRYRLIAGHRRLAAQRRLRAVTVPVLVMDPGNDLHRLSIQLVENVQRRALTPTDRRAAFVRLRDLAGGNTQRAATLLGIHPASYRRVIREADEPDPRSVARLSLGQTLKSLERWSDAAPRLNREKQQMLLEKAMLLVTALQESLKGDGDVEVAGVSARQRAGTDGKAAIAVQRG